jgi:hypothetical protein
MGGFMAAANPVFYLAADGIPSTGGESGFQIMGFESAAPPR